MCTVRHALLQNRKGNDLNSRMTSLRGRVSAILRTALRLRCIRHAMYSGNRAKMGAKTAAGPIHQALVLRPKNESVVFRCTTTMSQYAKSSLNSVPIVQATILSATFIVCFNRIT